MKKRYLLQIGFSHVESYKRQTIESKNQLKVCIPKLICHYKEFRDVSTGTTGTTTDAPKFSDTLTLFQPGEQILPQHRRSCTNISPTVTSLIGMCNLLVDLFVS